MARLTARAFRLKTRVATADPRGFTLIELLVAMSVLAILLTMSMVATTMIARSTVTSTQRASSSGQVLVVFQSIDRQVRWAEAINPAGLGVSGASYIEFRIGKNSNDGVNALCVQYRYVPTTGMIQTRTWNDGVSPTSNWTTKATGITGTPSSTYPFNQVPFSATGSGLQELVLHLTGGSTASGTTEVTTTFVARNSDAAVTNTTGTLVCNPTGYRP